MNKYEEALESARETNWHNIWHIDSVVSEQMDRYLDVLEELLNKYEKLEKALDKACETLVTYDTKGNYAKLKWNEEKWKEWLLKDE